MSHLIPTYNELRELFHHDQPPRRLLPSQIMPIAALIAALGWLLVVLFAASNHREAATAYPYYDTRGAVPPWSEPTPLEGNLNR